MPSLHSVLLVEQERVDVLEPFKLALVDVRDLRSVVRRELHFFVSEHVVEVGEVVFSAEGGDVGRTHLRGKGALFAVLQNQHN